MKTGNRNNLILFALIAVSLTSCKKQYSCECTNPGGSYTAFTVKDTKQKAKQKCDDYYAQNFGTVVFNETSCKIK